MIFLNSRYARSDVTSVTQNDGTVHRTVMRTPPVRTGNVTVEDYLWVENDRIDLLASKFYGDPGLWWLIMDANPGIPDALSIKPGAVIKVPRSE